MNDKKIVDYTVKIDKQKMKEWIASTGMKAVHISRALGRSDNYISGVLCNGIMSYSSYRQLKTEFGITGDDLLEKTKEEPTPGYSLDIVVKPDRVKVTILYNGQELYSAFSRIKDNTELSLVQAISYATHMCYKLAEQKELRGDKNA